MKILHFEDDYPVARLTEKVLRRELGQDIEIENIKTEKKMRAHLTEHRLPGVSSSRSMGVPMGSMSGAST